MTEPVQELTRDVVMARRFALVEEIAVIAARHKEELAGLNEELGMCESFIRDTMNHGSEQSVNIKGVGMAYFTTKSKCQVRDFDSVVHTVLAAAPRPEGLVDSDSVWKQITDHFYQHGLWSMLTKAVAKETVKEYIGIHKAPPPGVEYSEFRDLSWKRG